jgi:hypothetical protein
MYDALNHGARRVCAGRWRRCRCPGPGRAGRIVLAVDVSPSLRSDAPPSSDRLFCHVYGRGEGSGPIDPGLAVLLRRRHRAGLDVVERATRRDPPRPRPRRSRRRARSPTATRSGAPTPPPARRRTARRVTRATSTRRRRSPRRPPGPPAAANRRARAAVRAARAPSAPRRDDLLATVRRPPVWSVVHAGSSIVQFGG